MNLRRFWTEFYPAALITLFVLVVVFSAVFFAFQVENPRYAKAESDKKQTLKTLEVGVLGGNRGKCYYMIVGDKKKKYLIVKSGSGLAITEMKK
ncbi:hypothetical protein KAR91_62975 [Candidatus Pacearchaeota archaeon]|nr:hypothetical protein [Candidatus Pacearchaeota archaeon]